MSDTTPIRGSDDPDQDYEVNLLVTVRGYGKHKHQDQTAKEILKALHTLLHTHDGVGVYWLEVAGSPGIWTQQKEIKRDDRNASAPEIVATVSQVDRPESDVDSTWRRTTEDDTRGNGSLFPGMGFSEEEIARMKK